MSETTIDTQDIPINIEDIMHTAYLQYSLSVNVGRAIPDVRDGLKPCNRRILFAMRQLGLIKSRPHMKSARVVGEVIGKYHPHGDSSVYDTLVRMAQDLYLWSTVEFGYVSFSDSTCCGSSHMPQKRNALSVEHIRSKTAHLCSSYLDIVMAMKGTTYSHSRDLFECMPPFWNSAETLTGILELYLDLFHDITFHYDRMEQLAQQHYTFATDLADLLVKREDISFRQAHNIVAAVVKAKDDNASEISLNELEQPFFQSIGRHLSIQADELSGVCSIRHCINSKTCDGSPAPLSCQKMLSLCRSQLGRDTDALSMIEGQLQQADIFFQKQLDNLLQSENNPI